MLAGGGIEAIGDAAEGAQVHRRSGAICGIVFAIVMVATWISLVVAAKAGFGKRRSSPPKEPP
jgi:hypothetical protein